MLKIVIACAVIFTLAVPAYARKADARSFDHFAHKSCSSSSCFSKHPSGRYAFPYHVGSRR